MKYFILIWAGMWRKKARTIFTLLSVVVAFLLFGLLRGINVGMESVVQNFSASRLYTSNKFSMAEGMPVALGRRIAGVSGVTAVTHWTYLGGYYQDRRNALPAFATNPGEMFKLYKNIDMTPGAVERMAQVRTGALVGKPIADRYGWKVGDVVPMGSSVWVKTDGRTDYQFEIVGIYNSTDPSNVTMLNGFFVNYDYFDEARTLSKSEVHYFIVGVDDPRRAIQVSTSIDELFKNSPDATRTQTEQALVASQIKQVADISFITNTIVGAVLFTLLFVTGNTMMQATRERIPELATLKTLGFTDAGVSLLVLSESMLLCTVAGLVGIALASVLLLFLRDLLGIVSTPPSVVAAGILAAIGIALLSGAAPAWQARSLRIVDALARK